MGKLVGSMGCRNVRGEKSGKLQDLDDLEAVRGVRVGFGES
jgi:hypothetical protein